MQPFVFSTAGICCCLGMSILCEYAIAAYFAYCPIFLHISANWTYHIFFPHKLAFLTAILILFVFLLPISITFCYLHHLVANRMAPTLWNEMGSSFKQFCTIFPLHIWCLCVLHIFKMPHKTDMPSCWVTRWICVTSTRRCFIRYIISSSSLAWLFCLSWQSYSTGCVAFICTLLP